MKRTALIIIRASARLIVVLYAWALLHGQSTTATTPKNTEQDAAGSAVGVADIPYEFWIGNTRLPAGCYSVSAVLESVVVFHNAQANTEMEAYFLPTGEPVPAGDHKLVFVVHNGQHYLRELWDSDGRAVLTSQHGLSLRPGDTETAIIPSKLAAVKH